MSGAGAQDAQDLYAVGRRHHEVEQNEARLDLLNLLERLRARGHRDVRQLRGGQGLDQHVATDGVVIDNENGTTWHD